MQGVAASQIKPVQRDGHGVRRSPDSDVPSRISDPTSLLEWRFLDRAIVTFHDESDVIAKEAAFREVIRAWAWFVPG
jgi:hypothetical protein